jgi:hypothetical protein
MRLVPALLLPLFLFLTAGSEPPQKELDRAQGALDAARAAGAEQYATQAFAAATAALQQAHEAVAQRDYRLALTRALDAGDRAQEAAKGAADGKARARSEAEGTINAANVAHVRLKARINSDRARIPRGELDAARQAERHADAALQKARASLNAGDYLKAKELVKDVEPRITAQIQALDAAEAARPVKPPKRRR